MNILKTDIVKFMIGLIIGLICSVGAYYIGVIEIGPVVWIHADMRPYIDRWILGILTIIIICLILMLIYIITEEIINKIR